MAYCRMCGRVKQNNSKFCMECKATPCEGSYEWHLWQQAKKAGCDNRIEIMKYTKRLKAESRLEAHWTGSLSRKLKKTGGANYHQGK